MPTRANPNLSMAAVPMQAMHTRWLTAIVLGSAMLASAGCNALPNWGPFREVPDRLPGVPTPAEKLTTLRKLAKDAGSRNAEEKQQVVHDLTKAIRDEPDPMIRSEIITTLGHYPAKASDAVMTSALSDPDADVRMAGCRAWSRRGTPEATKLLAEVVQNDADKDVRIAAAKALGKSRDPSAVAALGAVLDDGDPAMQHTAVLALRDVTGQDFGNDVNQWRQYVRGEIPKPDKPISMAERLRQVF
jgi:HEAT repeat protein